MTISLRTSLVNTRDHSFDGSSVGPDVTATVAAVDKSAVDRRNATLRPTRDFGHYIVVGAHVLLPPRSIASSTAIFTHHGPVRNRCEASVDRLVAGHGRPVFPACILPAAGPKRIPIPTSKRQRCRNFGRGVTAVITNTVSSGKNAFALFRQGFATSFRPTVRKAGSCRRISLASCYEKSPLCRRAFPRVLKQNVSV